ncbi:hypothetical protein JOQ06_019125 [Pogonophryne albipinna]|uniref:HAUS augmin-like complex subunit 1 n=1 Tax=Pogonophryne albipinna TaxID=1090488 RepID=A0AAD6AT10_9TELE|nr:hypothetical protein JOQ06_019125 [Pogonophryne albipinna]
MCEKISKVNSWLSEVFGDQPVPHFEVNTRTVDILFQLAQSSEARCRDTALLSEDLKQKASEYQAEGAHIRDVLLQGVGLSCSSVSKPTSDYLSALVDNAMVLGVRDTSLGSFMPAVNNLTNELLEEEKSNRRLERELRALRKRLGTTLGCQQNDQMPAQLVSRNMNKSLTHQAIVQLSEEATALKQEIIPLKNKLKPYMDLSPSPSLAQVKIEEAKRELAAIDSQLQMNIDLV